MLDLAVVIVTWQVRDLALDALRSLYADLETSDLNAKVYVVDNASDDGTVDAIRREFPQVELIASQDNLGFAAGNNLAIRKMGFDKGSDIGDDQLPATVYLLNPDTVTTIGATRKLYDALMRSSQVGLVGAHLEYGDGSFQHGAFAFPGLRQLWVEFFPTPGRFIEGRFNGRYPREDYAQQQPFSVDFTLGATMMLKREVIQQTGVFDESFFMYCEEVDWAWRIRKAGWEIQCVPSARVVHLVGQSTSQVKPRSLENLWSSRLRLFKKHYPPYKLWLAKRMVVMGMRRKERQLLNDETIEDAEREALIAAYRRVIAMVQE